MVPISYNLRSLLVRKSTTAATALGIALVVFVLAASMMLTDGIRRTMQATGQPDHAIVLRKGADAELSSSIEQPTASIVMDAPQVKRGPDGPMAVAEIMVVITLDKVGEEGKVSNVQVRGVPDNVMAFRPQIKVVSGRPARPGTDEVLVGARIRGRFKGLTLGKTFELKKNSPVTVVGIFEADGSAFESEVWASVDTVRRAFGRDNLVSSVTVQLESPSKFDGFETQVESDKRMGLEAMREKRYYEKAGEGTAVFVTWMGLIIAIMFSLAAMLGALLTMHGAVAQRRREIGTLRALGFSRLAIMFSFMLEALMLALVGGALGVVAASFLGLVEVSMMNFATWSEIVFKFQPSGGVVFWSLFFGVLMGLFGGFLPALRAAYTSPTQAMRA